MVDEPLPVDAPLNATEAQTLGELRTLIAGLPDRAQLQSFLGYTFDGKRRMYHILGYKDVLTAQDFRSRYARGGIAARVVNAKPTAVWRGDGELIEDDNADNKTTFETQFDELNQAHGLWAILQRTHTLASITSFAVLLIGADGNLDEELPHGKPGDLLYFKPYGGAVVDPRLTNRGQASGIAADVTISAWETDSKSPRFGQPTMYRLQRPNVVSVDFQKEIHWSRVVHVPAPEFLDDAVFGPPTLESVWNYLDDLDKVVGGGAEAFWLRANAGIQFDIDKKMDVAAATSSVDELKKQAENYENQLTRIIRTRGVNVNQLGSDVANFKDPADALVTLIAGTKGIPKRILTGSEMGQLASTQDSDNWDEQIKDCRTGYASPIILRQLIERLIEFGYLIKPAKWSAKWPDVGALTETEKAAGALSWASTNRAMGRIVFTEDEIRKKWYDLDPLTDAEKAALVAVRESIDGAAGQPGQAVPQTAEQIALKTASSVADWQRAHVAYLTDEDVEMLHILEAALKANNIAVVSKVLGLSDMTRAA